MPGHTQTGAIVAAIALTVVSLGSAIHPARAARAIFDPSQPRETVLEFEDVLDKIMAGSWAFGYLAKSRGRLNVVNGGELQELLLVLQKSCAEFPGSPYSALVERMSNGGSVEKPSAASVEGRKLLLQFFDKDADHVTLTAALKPAPQDVRAVYAEPLATRMIANYEKLFQPGTAIRPKPKHVDLITIFTTTGKLKAGDPVLKEFPGGYKNVRRYIVGDVPIGRFKFVESGASIGLAFDGLIFVNGRWVLMPKPWRGLK
jgi:hypothetical protein